jgi:hypothetical protein
MKTIVAVAVTTAILTATAFAGGQALIGSRQIANKSIRLVDMHPSAVKALRGKRGFPGARGQPGPQGAQGAQGPPGLNGADFDRTKVNYVQGPDVLVVGGTVGFAEALCPAGTTVIGGGWHQVFAPSGEIGNGSSKGSAPNAAKTGWAASLHNPGPENVTFRAWAVCTA